MDGNQILLLLGGGLCGLLCIGGLVPVGWLILVGRSGLLRDLIGGGLRALTGQDPDLRAASSGKTRDYETQLRQLQQRRHAVRRAAEQPAGLGKPGSSSGEYTADHVPDDSGDAYDNTASTGSDTASTGSDISSRVDEIRAKYSGSPTGRRSRHARGELDALDTAERFELDSDRNETRGK